MRTRALPWYTIALALGLWGCASDLWYKQGAGTAALAQDKATCRAEIAQLRGAKASEAFEQCMSARDWLHVARGRSDVAAPPAHKVAHTPTRESTSDEVPGFDASALASPGPTPQRDATPETPPLDSAADPVALDRETLDEQIEETVLAPQPIDPRSRQFWIKLGAGPGQLETDQKSCRRELGLSPTDAQPSRWGQSDDFDACMRSRGWGGGSVSAAPNR